MKTLKLTLAIVLLAGTQVFAQGQDEKSPVVLLQEALYAEQAQSDLDKAIELYQQVIEKSAETQRLAAQATYQLGMCYLKKDDKQKAAEYFQKVINDYPTQKAQVQKAQKQLDKIAPAEKTLFEKVTPQVLRFISTKYGELGQEAQKKQLYINCQIYFVGEGFKVHKGGLGYFYNYTGQSITEKTRLTGTSFPDQTLYDVFGKKLNYEIIPDKSRPNFYGIYWIPDKPLAPEEAFYYGWSLNQSRNLTSKPEGKWLHMSNTFGQRALEVFFLVTPKDLEIVQSPTPTGIEKTLGNFDVYWWSDEVSGKQPHIVDVVLNKAQKIIVSQADKLIAESFAAEPNNKDAQAGLEKAEAEQKKLISTAEQEAEQAALEWLKLVDEGEYEKSWENAAEFFKKRIDLQSWKATVISGRTPLGKFISRKLVSKNYATQLPGAPAGKYIVIVFEAEYENQKRVFETITPMCDPDGKWRVSGYYIK